MTQRKIVITPKLNEQQAAKIYRALKDAGEWTVLHGDMQGVTIEDYVQAEIIFGWNDMVEACLQSEPIYLKWLQHISAGIDTIPFPLFKQKGILLTTCSGIHGNPISEIVLAMMLMFTRQMHQSMRDQLNSHWNRVEAIGEMHGQTIGLLGVGAIGVEIARIARAFGMKVIGLRRSGQSVAGIDQMYNEHQLALFLRSSDFVVNSLPLTDETKHMIGKPQLELMKPTAYYINIGRGGTTDTRALVEALQNHTIAGAGLDVFEQEPLPAEHPLWTMNNVIITPHNAGITPHYMDRASEIFATNLADYVANRSLSLNLVDLERQY